MTFDPVAYWQGQGGYLATEGVSEEHIAVEQRLKFLLTELDTPKDVLDVGCGRGRLASKLAEWLPKTAYHGLDLGTEQIKVTRKARPDGTLWQARVQDFDPKRRWDLVLCSEVLMHVPPDDMPGVATMLKRAARRHLVLIEWVPELSELSEPIAEWNWAHNYEALFGPFTYRERIYRQDVMLVTR